MASAGQRGFGLPQRLPGRAQGRQRIGGIHRERGQRFRQLAAVGIEHQRQVRITRRRQAERALQQDLARRGIEQVGAADDIGDPLRGIIDHDRQLVGPVAVRAAQHEVADFAR